MKTTIDISDDLFRQTKALARRRNTTLRALVETGLRAVLDRKDPLPTYTLPDLRTGKRGDAFLPGCDLRHWSSIRASLYADRGTRGLATPTESPA